MAQQKGEPREKRYGKLFDKDVIAAQLRGDNTYNNWWDNPSQRTKTRGKPSKPSRA